MTQHQNMHTSFFATLCRLTCPAHGPRTRFQTAHCQSDRQETSKDYRILQQKIQASSIVCPGSQPNLISLEKRKNKRVFWTKWHFNNYTKTTSWHLKPPKKNGCTYFCLREGWPQGLYKAWRTWTLCTWFFHFDLLGHDVKRKSDPKIFSLEWWMASLWISSHGIFIRKRKKHLNKSKLKNP